MRYGVFETTLESERDVLVSRREARSAAGLLGLDEAGQTALSTLILILARRAMAARSGAKLCFEVEEEPAPTLLATVSGAGGAGVDMDGAAALADSLEIDPPPESTVRVRMKLPAGAGLTPEIRSRFQARLRAGKSVNLVDEMLEQDRELLYALDRLGKRQKELEQVSQELEETNAGVMALYSELDERTQQLRRASELKSRFLSSFSHEIRTPVNSIFALSRILLNRLDGDLTPEQQKQVTFIRESAENLIRLVNDELDVARVEAGKVAVHVSEFAIGQIFGALRGMFKPLLQNPSVSLIFEETRDIPLMSTDEGKVAQILRNLISNALKFTHEGEIRVSANFDPSREVVAVSVRDTGIGIAPQDQERIFDEFVQLDAGDSAGGAGIGLHLSRRLAELLRGTLEVASASNSGSVFTATIPVRYTASGEVPVMRSPQARLSLLIIDDDRIARYALRQNLNDLGWRILEAEGGRQGLSMARSEKPDLIFLDLMMPDIGGYEVLRLLKTDVATKDIPVVIFTSVPRGEVDGNESAAQAEAVVFKSDVSRENVRGILQRLM
ncbi:MAG TPA: ATP-binding protein [Bryobacteraceae bacterium]|jgi:signal transduction histidine kinase/CheY-like chemotaxis protein|nr:ATP-binding protein [Bryobacteraceae bacterium]